MSQIRTLFAATAAVAIGSSTALLLSSDAKAEPPQPIPGLPALQSLQLPGLPAIEQLSPVIQQAAADPSGAVSLLMAAAAALTGNSAAPTDAKQVADSVTQFVQAPTAPGSDGLPQAQLANDAPAAPPRDPSAHIPTPGSAPGAVAHLPTGVDPAHRVGPRWQAVPATPVVPEAVAAPAPPAPDAAPAPALPEAAGPAPGATPVFGPDSPPTQDFMYPSIGTGCLSDGGNSIATALSVAGPAKIPTPGPASGQTAYVFTAVGTPGPAETQKLPLNVTWVNLTTGKSGTATLTPRPDINPEGPTTLTAVVDTGSGSIISTIFGQVSTKDRQCNFIPTIGSTVVP